MKLRDVVAAIEACSSEGDPVLDCEILILHHAIKKARVAVIGDGDHEPGRETPFWPPRAAVLREIDGGALAYHLAPAYTSSLEAAWSWQPFPIGGFKYDRADARPVLAWIEGRKRVQHCTPALALLLATTTALRDDG